MPEPTEQQGQQPATEEPDYKALYEQAQADADKWKERSRKNEGRAKSNAEAARGYEDATQQLADLTKRLDALEGENATLKAQAARNALVAKVAKSTGVPEGIVASLSAQDEDALSAAATAIAEAYKAPGGAPSAPEAGTFAVEQSGSAGGDWLREALTKR